MMSHSYRFGIVGCGTISDFYARAIAELENAELAGAFDVNPGAGKAFCKKNHTAFYGDFGDFLASDIEAVCICTPSGLHARYAVAAADAGKHVVVEKPMGITEEQLDDIVRACDRNHIKLCAISQLLFSDAVQRVKAAVDGGELGRPILADVTMKYYRSEEYYRQGGWRGTWDMDGGGALMNQGIHGVSLLQYVMGPVRSVTALAKTQVHAIEVEDTAVALLEFCSGALGYIVGTTSVTPGQPRVLNIHGERGTLTVTEDRITQWCVDDRQEPAFCGGAAGQNTASNPTDFPVENHRRQLQDFVRALSDGTSPMLDQHEGRKPVDLILAIYRSAKTKETVYFEK